MEVPLRGQDPLCHGLWRWPQPWVSPQAGGQQAGLGPLATSLSHSSQGATKMPRFSVSSGEVGGAHCENQNTLLLPVARMFQRL